MPNVNILGRSVDTVKKNAEALAAATKEIGLGVNADKTKYMTVYGDQNAGRIDSTGCFKKSFTILKAYRNLYRGHTQRFELSKM